MAANLLRYVFTSNLYVFTCKGFLANALGVIPNEPKVANEFLETCEKLKLCGIVYSSQPLDGFYLINTNDDPDTYQEMYSVPNHLELVQTETQ